MDRSNEKFSGWRVLVGCLFTMFLVQGGLQTFAVYMPSIATETGWSLSQVAIVSTTATVGAFLSNLVIAPLIKKVGSKVVLLLGGAFLVGHWILYAVSPNAYVLWFAGFLGGAAIGFGTIAPCSIIMTNWFVKNRSSYISYIVAASMFGSALLNPIAGRLIENFGWRGAYKIQALTVGVLAVLVIIFLIIESPEKKGQKAYGSGEVSESTGKAQELGGVDVSTARSTSSFYLLIVGTLLIGCSTNIENYMPAFWQSTGISKVTSASIMGAYAFIAAVGAIIMGRVNDKMGGKIFVMATTTMFVGSTLIMVLTGVVSIVPLLIIVCIPFAIGSKKASGMIPPLVVAETFGRKHYATIIGTFTAMLQLGIAVSNPIIGKLLDVSGGYRLPFISMAVANIIGMVLIYIALVKKPFSEKKSKEVHLG